MTNEESIRKAVIQQCQHYYELEPVMGDRPSSTPLAIMSSLDTPGNYVMSDVDDEGTKASETSSSVKVMLNAKRNADNQLSLKKNKKAAERERLHVDKERLHMDEVRLKLAKEKLQFKVDVLRQRTSCLRRAFLRKK